MKIMFRGQFKTAEGDPIQEENYLADALEESGCRVIRAHRDESVVMTGSDISICSRHGDVDKCPRPRVFWTRDHPGALNRKQIFDDFIRKSDMVIDSGGLAHVSDRPRFYLPGACDPVDIGLSPNPQINVLFFGRIYSDRREKIRKTTHDFGGLCLDSPSKWIYGAKLARLVQHSKIVIGDNWTNDVEGYWSSRNYVVPGAGGFLLTSDVPGMEGEFYDGQHVAIYDGVDDLRSKVDYWIRQAVLREGIRFAGYNYVRSRHTWTKRAGKLIEILTKYLTHDI